MKIAFIFLGLCCFTSRANLNLEKLIPNPNQISFENNVKVIDPCDIEFVFIPSLSFLKDTPDYYYNIIEFFYKTTFPEKHCPHNKMRNNHIVKSNKVQVLKVKIRNYVDYMPNYLSSHTDESYKLALSAIEWRLEAENYNGFLRGFETLMQLIEPIERSQEYQINYFPISIDDSPELSYNRGIMIDTARHYLKVNVLKHVIDSLLFHKLYAFHWHIVDEKLDSFPKRTNAGAHSSKEIIYTNEDVAEIVKYARYRGVRIIPEIDSPAHSLSWGFSEDLKDIALQCFLWAKYKGHLNKSLEKNYEVFQGILNDVNQMLPNQEVHLGGNEVSFSCWESKPWIQACMQTNIISNGAKLQSYYQQIEENLIKIPWLNETKFDNYPQDIRPSLYHLIKDYANKVVWSPYDYLFIDLGYGNVFGDKSWTPFVTWKNIYNSFNHFPEEITRSRILGGELTLWAELNSDIMMDEHLMEQTIKI